MSRTDKDRPHLIQLDDPDNRRFAKAGHTDTWTTRARGVYTEWTWKKLSPATQCWCCSHKAWLPYKRARRSSWRREVRWVLADMAQAAENRAYWLRYATYLQERFATVTDLELSADNLEQYFSFEYWNDRSEVLLATVDFDGCYTTTTEEWDHGSV